MKKIISILGGLVLTFVFVTSVSAVENWKLSGNYTLTFTCVTGCGGNWVHTMQVTLYDNNDGSFSGTGFYNAVPSITWTVSGDVTGDTIEFYVDYDGSSYYVDADGTIAISGAMSGTAASSYQTFTWVMSPVATFNRRAEITSPDAGEVVSGLVNFEAYLVDDDYDGVQWAVRQGTCAAGIGTVWGNVDGHNDPFTWTYNAGTYTHSFISTADTSSWAPGSYCFVFNPREDSSESDIRLTREFILADTTAPLVDISSPLDGEVLAGSVDIVGSVTDDGELSHYNLSLYPGTKDLSDGQTHSGDRLNDNQWCTTPTSGTVYLTNDFSGNLCTGWDTTQYDDGEYQIRLAARDAAGNRDTSDPYTGNTSSVHVIRITINNTPDNKDQCKKGGWMSFYLPTFKNQGDCVSWIQSNENAVGNRKDN